MTLEREESKPWKSAKNRKKLRNELARTATDPAWR
jgi:hypothetical protein